MSYNNYHTHTLFCDGADSPEELVKTALSLGCTELGFSGHSYTDIPQDWDCCMSPESTERYRQEIKRLQAVYRGRIKLLLGIEQDFFSPCGTDGYDYVIGSVHYVCKDGNFLCVDASKQAQLDAVKKHYGGDFYAFCEDYYALVGEIYSKTGCDIVGHFDLVTKFNEDGDLFDVHNERYVRAWQNALAKLLGKGLLFEVNYGAIARGYRTTPYPAQEILSVLRANGERLMYSSDCHRKELLLFGCAQAEQDGI